MKIYKLNPDTDFNELCKLITPHKMGQKIMSEKSQIHFFFIKDLKTPAANILKQDALRVGAELVTHKEVITAKISHSNALLMATKEQISKLIQKEKMQDFGLKTLAKFLEKDFAKPKFPKLMAVLNLNDDSFNPESRVGRDNIEKRLEELLSLEPDYIDIGAASSRPGSVYCGSEEEFSRLKFSLDLIFKKNYFKQTKFSLDSFDKTCIRYALDRGFKLINDISGDISLVKLAKEYKSEYCLMHMQNTPSTMQLAPKYDDLLFELDEFFAKKLELCGDFKDIILDIGIGFGKTPKQNLLLIKHLEHFLHFNKPLLVGASRKSVINAFYKSEVEQRLAGTLFLHLKAYENGASILRVHDLYEHKQMFKMCESMGNLSYE